MCSTTGSGKDRKRYVSESTLNKNCNTYLRLIGFSLDIESKAKERSIPSFVIADAGLTQIKEGSLTVCGLGPVPSDMVNPITSTLKLL